MIEGQWEVQGFRRMSIQKPSVQTNILARNKVFYWSVYGKDQHIAVKLFMMFLDTHGKHDAEK